jgi:hypothetical protein
VRSRRGVGAACRGGEGARRGRGSKARGRALAEGRRKGGENGKKEKKKRKEKRKGGERKKGNLRKKGKKRIKGKEKLEENFGENREIRKRIFGGISRFSGAGVISGTAVMARRASRRHRGKPGIPSEVADSGAGAARSERRWPE